jgi:pimeloyl-ACP methyl ester carboxylesterase/DNA-binding CsgD family transcriptional regulator
MLTELQIQYCRAADGVRIAFYTMGVGPPLVHTPPFPLGHLRVEWRNPANQDYIHRLCEGITLVRYDGRGCGLSDRDVADFSDAARSLDVEAVADHLSLRQFALLGFGHAGSMAVAYAAEHPERVSHLILWHSYASAADVPNLSRIQAARSLIQTDWNSYAELEGYRASGFRGGAAARWYTEFIKESVSPEALAASYSAIGHIDVRQLLPAVRCPTLVLARRASEVLPLDIARDLTTSIPDARLVTLEGSGVIPFPDVVDEFVSAVRTFLSTPARRVAAGSSGPADRPPSVLTPRETEILRLIAEGHSSGYISQELSLSIRTVGRHITNVYKKIGARTRADATAYAIRNRIA